VRLASAFLGGNGRAMLGGPPWVTCAWSCDLLVAHRRDEKQHERTRMNPPREPPRGPTLRLVCVNDVYTLENLPRLRSLVEHHRLTSPADALLVTLAGDFLAPSVLSSLDHGRGMVDCMNAIGFTHVTFGNHEDDVPPEELRRRAAELHAVWLNSNVRGFVPALPVDDVVVVAHEGGRSVRVGLLGVVMNEPSLYQGDPFGGCQIAPANAAAQAVAARLMRDEGCACVVPLTHQPLADDRALAAAQREPPFPVIIGGHEHQIVIEQLAGTSIVKAGADAIDAVVVDLAWPAVAPPPGVPDLPFVTTLLEATARYPEDAALRRRVDGHMKLVEELERATLLTLAPGQELSSVGTRVRQTSMGTLICNHLRDALGAEAAMFNGGGIRASRVYRERVTYGDIKGEVPFDNEMVVVELPGGVLRDAIAASRAHAPTESGSFLQVDDRVTVSGDAHTLTAIAGAPLDVDRRYRVAIVRDLLTGLDRIEPLVRFGHEHPERVPRRGSGRDVKVLLVDALSVSLWNQLGGFDAVDTDRNDFVDKPELTSAIARFTREPPSGITADLVLNALDMDHDRLISRQEALAAKPPPRRPGSHLGSPAGNIALQQRPATAASAGRTPTPGPPGRDLLATQSTTTVHGRLLP
jgi:2',3'-cyclic-nucleotide 2'-phosphodiesterase (5'-nucleotidase family)